MKILISASGFYRKERMAENGNKLLIIALMTVFLALVPFLFWRATWFGGKLSDVELQRYLTSKNPRNIQHALAQAAERLINGRSQSGKPSWYLQVAAMTDHPQFEIRGTAAWVMGQDNSLPEFHTALIRMLQDPEPIVRRNAALSLVRFADLSARPELLEMIRPYSMLSPRSGKLSFRLEENESVSPGTLLARLVLDRNETAEIRSPLAGRVTRKLAAEGRAVKAGDPVMELGAAPEQVWEALRALVLMGRAEDLVELKRLGRTLGESGFEARVRRQLELTIRAIESRP